MAREKAVLAALLYFDVFDHPLTREEILRFMSIDSSQEEVDQVLHHLVETEVIHCHGGFYACKPAEKMASKRSETTARAQEMMPIAKQMASFIARFPFVRGVLLSGSISKEVMHEHSDIDYFIIVEEGRMWLSLLLLKAYKKLFMGRRQKYFCLNYFIAHKPLVIEEESIFTAVELATLMPIVGDSYKQKIIEANPWVKDVLPNFRVNNASENALHVGKTRKLIEYALRSKIGDRLDHLVQRKIRQWYQRKYAHARSNADFDLMFKSNNSESKVHTSNHHRMVLDRYAKRLNDHNIVAEHVML